MQGQYKLIGERPTYFPPFVNERFDDSWWSCTFASLLNATNVGWRGAQPATHHEVRALANASGDPHVKDGSRSHHMINAMRRRYEQTMQLSALPPRRIKRRLGHGWVMVAGLTYSRLPKQYRETDFTDGHRVLLIGWHNDHTWIVDPLHETRPDLDRQAHPVVGLRSGVLVQRTAVVPRRHVPAAALVHRADASWRRRVRGRPSRARNSTS